MSISLCICHDSVRKTNGGGGGVCVWTCVCVCVCGVWGGCVGVCGHVMARLSVAVSFLKEKAL